MRRLSRETVRRVAEIHDMGGYVAISNAKSDDSLSRILSYRNDVKGRSAEIGAGVPIQFLTDDEAPIVKDVALIDDSLRGTPLKSGMFLSGRVPTVERLECGGVHANHGQYGLQGSGAVEDAATLERVYTDHLFRGYTLYCGAHAARFYPPGNQLCKCGKEDSNLHGK